MTHRPPPPVVAKDPTAAFMLSMFLPGLGFAYAGNVRNFLTFLVIESLLWYWGLWVALLGVHVFQAISAAGAVKLWNQQNAAGPGLDIPPPPAPGVRTAGATPAPEPRREAVPVLRAPAAPVTLGSEAFLAELQDAWRDHRAAKLTAREFADRKFRAIRSVRVDAEDEGEALVAAAQELSSSGVLTSEEVAQLSSQVLLR